MYPAAACSVLPRRCGLRRHCWRAPVVQCQHHASAVDVRDGSPARGLCAVPKSEVKQLVQPSGLLLSWKALQKLQTRHHRMTSTVQERLSP